MGNCHGTEKHSKITLKLSHSHLPSSYAGNPNLRCRSNSSNLRRLFVLFPSTLTRRISPRVNEASPFIPPGKKFSQCKFGMSDMTKIRFWQGVRQCLSSLNFSATSKLLQLKPSKSYSAIS